MTAAVDEEEEASSMDLGEIKKGKWGFLKGKGRNGLCVRWGFGGERDGKWGGGDENKEMDIVELKL